MTIETELMTWSEFATLETPENGDHYELHDGEVVIVPPASPQHFAIQRRLRQLLEAALGNGWVVEKEFPYRPTTELQYWVADIAVVTRENWQKITTAEEWIAPCAPAMIVEILSRSNRKSKVARQRLLALSNGAEEFWVVDPRAQTVSITTSLGLTTTYAPGETLPADITVDAIFQKEKS